MTQRRVLILSTRRASRWLGFAAAYEAEDLVREWEGADLLAPELVCAPGVLSSLSRRLERHAGLSLGLARRMRKCKIERDYDLIYMHCMDLHYLEELAAAAPGWRQRCRLAVCRIEEAWSQEIAQHRSYYDRHYRELLSLFDLVVVGCAGGVPALAPLARDRCIYAPAGVDAPIFCPVPFAPSRSIDVMNMGRRSPHTHQAFLDLTRDRDLFYIYDTMSDCHLLDHRQHRSTLANFVKRARYFVAYRAKCDFSVQTGDQEEIGFRFFEGAAGGAVIIGDPPTSPEFHRQFDWPDAVVRLPFGSTKVAAVLDELDSDPGRLETIRHNNVVGTLRKHDWVYRWEQVLAQLGLEPTFAMKRRKEELGRMAARLTPGVARVGAR
jgi:hypothetical protein